MDVTLLVYDLSGGMARQMSMGLLGFQLDAVYHTSIMLDGREYVYDGKVVAIAPGSSHLGAPMEWLPLGQTSLPMDIIEEYLDSLRRIYTVEAYDLWHHNCNNFSNDFATFLVGEGIPDHILNMPEAVINSPLGAMLLPALNQRVTANRQNGGILGIEENSQKPGEPEPARAHTQGGKVQVVTSMGELDSLLTGASRSCAVVFFTSATCGPCKMLYPVFDELAAEVGDRAVLAKVDVSLAYDISSRYSIQATPTFITFLKGEQDRRWSGSSPHDLRANVRLLLQMAWPLHLHESLNLPTFARGNLEPVLFARVPPLPKLVAKMGDAATNHAVQDVTQFLEARGSKGPADAHLPDMAAFAAFLQSSSRTLPAEVMFAVVDLLRCALVDPRVSGCLAEEKGHTTVSTLLNYVNGLPQCPYALRLVTLQMACNLFSTPLYPDEIIGSDQLRVPVIQLLSASLLDNGHINVRVAAASLLFNLALANNPRREKGSVSVLSEGDEIELAAMTLEAISREEQSAEALEGLLFGLGLLAYRLPLDGELAALLRVMDAANTILAKKKHFKDMALINEVGSELLEKGLRKP